MSRKPTIPISKEQYDLISQALGMTRKGLGAYLQVSEHAPGWWRSQERIPEEHLQTIRHQLRLRVGERAPNKTEKEALDLLDQLLALSPVFAAEGSATNADFHLDRLIITPCLNKPLSQMNYPTDLSNVDLQDLVKEIERRGWAASLVLKKE